MYGGAKFFNYGVEKSDLQVINTSLVNLGFSSSASSTDNTGYGFDVGFGIKTGENISLEAGYVDYGTLTINTTTTGPAETLKLDIGGNGVTAGAKLELEGYYVKGGMHSWDFTGKISSSKGNASEPLGSGTDPYLGIGFGYDGFEIGYEYYALNDGDISALNFRFAYEF